MRLLRSFCADRSGNVAIIFALTATVLMVAIGGAVDVGRWLHARDQTVAAIDAAMLAGGRALQTDSSNKSAAIAAAKKYYDENVTSRLPVIDDTVKFVVAPDGMGITASGTAYIKTPFLQFATIDKLPLLSTRQSGIRQVADCRRWRRRREHRGRGSAGYHRLHVQLAPVRTLKTHARRARSSTP